MTGGCQYTNAAQDEFGANEKEREKKRRITISSTISKGNRMDATGVGD